MGTNIVFLVRITCELCGHTLLFDSERFTGADEPAFDPEPPYQPE
jgi:hypothetical protein